MIRKEGPPTFGICNCVLSVGRTLELSFKFSTKLPELNLMNNLLIDHGIINQVLEFVTDIISSQNFHTYR